MMQPIVPISLAVAMAAGVMTAALVHLVRDSRTDAPRRGMLRVGIPRFLRLTGIVILAFLLNLRIQRPVPDRNAEFRNIDVLFVLDDTLSMYGRRGVRLSAHHLPA